MMFKKPLKSIVIATFLFAMVLNIQPSFAMDDGDTQSNILSMTRKAYNKFLEFVGKDEQFEPGQLPLQSQTPFFKDLPNEDIMLQQQQLEELEWLKEILGCRIPQVIDKDDQNTPDIPAAFLDALGAKLTTALRVSENSTTTLGKYLFVEHFLERTNEELIQEYLKHMKQKGLFLNINLRGSITRLPFEAIGHIQKKIDLADKDTTVRISLACNKLRRLPKELFSIKNIHILDIRNNLLSALPPIEDAQETITHLLLGNYNDYSETMFPLLNERPYLRTQGNVFETLPTCVLKLKNLSHLDLRSVKLCNFPKKEFLDDLPNLLTLNLDHNDLNSLPKPTDKNRTVAITSMGHSLLSRDGHTMAYTFHNFVKPKIINFFDVNPKFKYKGPYEHFVRPFELTAKFFVALPQIILLYHVLNYYIILPFC